MVNLTSVGISSGVPNSGTGTVSTLDGVFQTANGTITIKPASSGAAATSDIAMVVTLRDVNANGGTTAANSAPVVPADQYGTYKTVAASQTAQVLGAVGATGDYLAGLLIVPATTAAGTVSITDGAGSAITVFTGGGTLGDLKPFMVPIGAFSTSGAWKVTTGTNVSAIGIGKFT